MPRSKISDLLATQEAVDAFRRYFKCRRCGTCCHAFEGIKVTKAEAESLPLTLNARRGIAELFDGTYFLKEPCPFYNAAAKACGIYDNRPATCRNFPLYNQRGVDGHVHLGTAEMCPAGLESLTRVEAEWGRKTGSA
jgi:Fe-S-cluster containining protein